MTCANLQQNWFICLQNTVFTRLVTNQEMNKCPGKKHYTTLASLDWCRHKNSQELCSWILWWPELGTVSVQCTRYSLLTAKPQSITLLAQQVSKTNLAATSWGESELTSSSGRVSDDDGNIGSIARNTHIYLLCFKNQPTHHHHYY